MVANNAEIAQLMELSRARVTQIMALLNLAPEIQEQILTTTGCRGSKAIPERAMRPITRLPIWEQQRKMWSNLLNVI